MKQWQRASGATGAGGKGREGKITGRAQETARGPRSCRFPDWTPVTPSSNPQVSRRKAGRRGGENRSDRHLVAYSGENSGKLASGNSRSEQSQSEPQQDEC